MLNLMTGGYNHMTLEDLKSIPVTARGERTERWQGVQHGELVNTMKTVLKDQYSFNTKNETYAVSPNGAAIIGGFELALLNYQSVQMGLPQHTSFSVGFIHSNDSRKALTLCFGGRVALCENGMVVSDYTLKRKHTKGLYLRDWLREGFAGLTHEISKAQVELNKMATIPVNTGRHHDEMLVKLGREGVIPWRLLGEVDKGWHDAHEKGAIPGVEKERWDEWNFQGSMLDWYNCVTHTAKKIPPANQLTSLKKSYDLVKSYSENSLWVAN